ncbi:MAG TPA: glycoside hydrolase 43 family protein [Tepidisphaeraceae bacterium]|nr:glycoside hydrolase 43 family protein [Tepidisphaeraceae bacterium]
MNEALPTDATGFAYPWTPDQGDGTFRNPVIHADYSDPDVVRDGDDYYLVSSSFNCTPALPILHSRDLVNWTIVNHAVKNLPDPRYATVQPGQGVWAPSIRKHAGKFWIFFPTPDEGIYVITADDPRGRWSEPHLLAAGKGLIDPCPLWDDDGKAYLVHAYAHSRSGIKHRLRVAPMSPDGSHLIGEGKIVFDQPERHPTCEGPKFYKRAGMYYILAPAGGVATGWQLALRSRNIYGPYEAKVVLAQGSTPINGPHQGALVDTPDTKQWWFVHFQDVGLYGRIVHLQPVRWVDGWPMMGGDHGADGVGEPVLVHRKPAIAGQQPIAIPQTSDEFDENTLGLQWQWNANHADDWASLTARPGHLRLRSLPDAPQSLQNAPNLLCQKFPARSFSVETEVELMPGAPRQAGLIIIGKSHAATALEWTDRSRRLLWIVEDHIAATEPDVPQRVRLAVDVAHGGRCTFRFARPGEAWQRIGDAYQATPGHWIGARVGLFCRGNADAHADFAHFRMNGTAE